MFTELQELLEHMETYCQLRMQRRWRVGRLCVQCKDAFHSPWDLMVHVQAAHMLSTCTSSACPTRRRPRLSPRPSVRPLETLNDDMEGGSPRAAARGRRATVATSIIDLDEDEDEMEEELLNDLHLHPSRRTNNNIIDPQGTLDPKGQLEQVHKQAQQQNCIVRAVRLNASRTLTRNSADLNSTKPPMSMTKGERQRDRMAAAGGRLKKSSKSKAD
ncbi:Hypothetical predicted protein [Cloeon dipterum]|uniref:C2H2-type domain-containing protein n=1 Tax=Cloeon dipterum TaxID=197152 RepID=A0A8S1DR30_9INSE|nr:Hypothetical predicted protein [Cloeon dipterum]